ncbi:MAG: hypothetical protein AB8B72_06890 [Crocinitomicaceae bacterium]
MNTIKSISTLFLFTVIVSGHTIGQEIDSTSQKQIEFLKKIYYTLGQDIYKTQDTKFKLNSSYVAPWEKISSKNTQALQNSLDSIVKNGIISINQNQFSRTSLIFSSQLEAIDDLSDLFNIKLIDFNIVDSLKTPVKVNKSNSTNYGSKSGSGIKDGESFSYDYRTIKTLFQLDSKKPVIGASGTVKLEVSFPSSYEKVLITANDKGKEFYLKNKKYKVLEIVGHKIILKQIDSSEEESLQFSFVNTNKAGDKIAQIPFYELRKMNEGKEVDLFSSTSSKKTMSENIYNIFKNNPDITQSEFDSILEPILLDVVKADDPKIAGEKLLGEKIIILTCAGPIDQLFLYVENRELKRTFTKSL